MADNLEDATIQSINDKINSLQSLFEREIKSVCEKLDEIKDNGGIIHREIYGNGGSGIKDQITEQRAYSKSNGRDITILQKSQNRFQHWVYVTVILALGSMSLALAGLALRHQGTIHKIIE